MDSKTRAQLKKQLTIFRKAKGKLSRYGHDTDSSNGQLLYITYNTFAKS